MYPTSPLSARRGGVSMCIINIMLDNFINSMQGQFATLSLSKSLGHQASEFILQSLHSLNIILFATLLHCPTLHSSSLYKHQFSNNFSPNTHTHTEFSLPLSPVSLCSWLLKGKVAKILIKEDGVLQWKQVRFEEKADASSASRRDQEEGA